MLSGFLVVLVYQATLPAIQENQRRAIERAVFQVVPGATSRRDFIMGTDRLYSPGEEGAQGTRVYAGYDNQSELQGMAMEAAAQGYQDVIKILFGYSPECECITGIHVLKMTETPGLGDKIAFDPEFLANFERLDARLRGDQAVLANAIVTVKHGRKAQPWQIDAISGATVSSNAIGKMLNQAAQENLPRLIPFIAEFRLAGVAEPAEVPGVAAASNGQRERN